MCNPYGTSCNLASVEFRFLFAFCQGGLFEAVLGGEEAFVAWPSRSNPSGQVLAMSFHGEDARATPPDFNSGKGEGRGHQIN
jgi:hypothetical protein